MDTDQDGRRRHISTLLSRGDLDGAHDGCKDRRGAGSWSDQADTTWIHRTIHILKKGVPRQPTYEGGRRAIPMKGSFQGIKPEWNPTPHSNSHGTGWMTPPRQKQQNLDHSTQKWPGEEWETVLKRWKISPKCDVGWLHLDSNILAAKRHVGRDQGELITDQVLDDRKE